VLALEAEPSPVYLRWLSERVTVERPYPGFLASQALITAALRLARDHLPKLRDVVRIAVNKLALQSDDPDHPGSPAHERKHELDVAGDLAQMRNDKLAAGIRLNE